MKRTVTLTALLLLATALFAGPQFRLATHAYTPFATLPESADEWDHLIVPSHATLTGWHWEVVLNRLGFGMHYGMQLTATEERDAPYLLDWKGDFFLSYHLFGGGSLIDPFVEVGWANAGRTTVNTANPEYPDWEDEVRSGNAVSLALYTYGAAGVALDLGGLLLGARLSYIPVETASPVPDPHVGFYELQRFELGIFGGIALGSHDRQRPDRGDRWEDDRRDRDRDAWWEDEEDRDPWWDDDARDDDCDCW